MSDDPRSPTPPNGAARRRTRKGDSTTAHPRCHEQPRRANQRGATRRSRRFVGAWLGLQRRPWGNTLASPMPNILVAEDAIVGCGKPYRLVAGKAAGIAGGVRQCVAVACGYV